MRRRIAQAWLTIVGGVALGGIAYGFLMEPVPMLGLAAFLAVIVGVPWALVVLEEEDE